MDSYVPHHTEDRIILLKMIMKVCIYKEYVNNIINIQDSQSNLDCPIFVMGNNNTIKETLKD